MSPGLALLILAATAVGMVVLAARLRVPYPIFVLLGGLALGFTPGMPEVAISPDVVLLVLLPPLLYSAAFFLPLREFRANLRPITVLAVVVVALTTAAVAVVAHVVLGLGWAVAFVLGAIVSPTDPTAVEAIARRLALPRRLISVIQGESLVNDGTALVIYASAVLAVTDGTFSVPAVGARLVLGILGGIAIGLAVGWIIAQIRARIDSPPEELAISLLAAYAAYLPANELGASGVLAAVTIGAYHGRRQSEVVSPTTRLQTFSFWELLVYLVNGGLFILVGLQLPGILDDLGGQSVGALIGDALLVTAVVVAVRVAWVGTATAILRRLDRGRGSVLALPGRHAVIVAATGMRGAVSLAAALAIPMEVGNGRPFPDRPLLIFVAFAVILLTLIPQGLGLPFLIERLGLEGDEQVEREESEARLEAARAAIERLEELRGEPWVRDDSAQRLEERYRFREQRFAARLGEEERAADGDDPEARSADFQRLRGELIAAERAVLLRLRDEGRIDGDVVGRVERDLDLEFNRLEA
jgi:monovalent cation/hydrogen antiporter